MTAGNTSAFTGYIVFCSKKICFEPLRMEVAASRSKPDCRLCNISGFNHMSDVIDIHSDMSFIFLIQ